MALRYLVTGGTGNWNSTTNWSATSGGASGASFPTASDDVVMDNNSHSAGLTVNTNSACLSFSASPSYTGTLTATNQITSSGNVTLGSGMTISGVGILTFTNASNPTLTSHGKTWTGALNMNLTGTFTFADDWTVNGLITLTTSTYNGSNLKANGGVTLQGGGNCAGTTTLQFVGAGTFTTSTTTLQLNVVFNLSGTLSIVGATFNYNTGTMTYTAGTISLPGGHTLAITLNTTLNTSGIIWININFNNNTTQTLTLSSLLTCTGTLTVNNGAAATSNFGGTAGFNVGTFTITTATTPRFVALTAGITYIITGNINIAYFSTSHTKISSLTPGSKAILTLQQGATQDIGYCDATDIDSSAGQTFWTYKGTIATSFNWNLLPVQPKMVSSLF